MLVDVQDIEPRAVTADTLDDYYRWIGCEYVEADSVLIGGKNYIVICNEEKNPAAIVSAVTPQQKPLFRGNLLIFKGADKN